MSLKDVIERWKDFLNRFNISDISEGHFSHLVFLGHLLPVTQETLEYFQTMLYNTDCTKRTGCLTTDNR
jgi:hypothetical protein